MTAESVRVYVVVMSLEWGDSVTVELVTKDLQKAQDLVWSLSCPKVAGNNAWIEEKDMAI